jgi:hypothetical protein
MRTVALVGIALSTLAAGCASRTSPDGGVPPRATIVCAPEPWSGAYATLVVGLKARLDDGGYSWALAETPLTRRRTAIAVYDAGSHPERLEAVREWCEELGLPSDEVVLPFLQHGAGGNAIVAWLVPGSLSQ